MGSPDDRIAALLLESISLMSKRFVQKDWPALVPELASYLQQQQSMQSQKRALEAIKKICKKYRYMFRSDDLYREMNYMIENLSPLLLNNICVSDSASLKLTYLSFRDSAPAAPFNSASRWVTKR